MTPFVYFNSTSANIQPNYNNNSYVICAYSVLDNEIEVVGVKSGADNSLSFDINFNYTTCFVNGRSVVPFLMLLKLIERQHIDDVHYISIPPSL